MQGVQLLRLRLFSDSNSVAGGIDVGCTHSRCSDHDQPFSRYHSFCRMHLVSIYTGWHLISLIPWQPDCSLELLYHPRLIMPITCHEVRWPQNLALVRVRIRGGPRNPGLDMCLLSFPPHLSASLHRSFQGLRRQWTLPGPNRVQIDLKEPSA